MSAYYNENDPFAAEWLRSLIKAGHITPGDVDDRSILDVRGSDLTKYTQCHFFAGIGGWSYALRLAGWPDDRPVWTGSCPCQPFSSAGRRGGITDDRHLWPVWYRLIRECRPDHVFGEQVASGDGLAWLDLVLSDLEGANYAAGAVDLCAAGVGAPHLRQRLYFVGDSFVAVSDLQRREGVGLHLRERGPREGLPEAGRGGEAGALVLAERGGRGQGLEQRPLHGGAIELADADSKQSNQSESTNRTPDGGTVAGWGKLRSRGHCATHGFWTDAEWIPCTDGKARPVEPGTFPLAARLPGDVGRLRGYGNAIVPPLAAIFIQSYLEASRDP